jgi:hypothetical protein
MVVLGRIKICVAERLSLVIPPSIHRGRAFATPPFYAFFLSVVINAVSRNSRKEARLKMICQPNYEMDWANFC